MKRCIMLYEKESIIAFDRETNCFLYLLSARGIERGLLGERTIIRIHV